MNYDWGRIGRKSGVTRVFSLNSWVKIEEDRPHDEFWMGTHDSGPSFVVDGFENGVTLSLKLWITKNPHVLRDNIVQKWGVNLHFLFKAHPDKELAVVLYKMWPDVFKDDNHNPKMAL
ncbi:mannose-6-phosphate isomerase, partial [Sarracenia purpurea var. burkii]